MVMNDLPYQIMEADIYATYFKLVSCSVFIL